MSFKVALLQTTSPEGDDARAMARIGAGLRAAAAMGAKVLVAPETYLPGYNQDDIPDRAQPRGGEWHRELSALCAATRVGLVVGYTERDGEKVYNAAVAFDGDGGEIAHYRKVQLFGPRERSIYAPGDAYAVFDLGGSKAALMICYDIEFAPHVAALAARGVKIILVPTANPEPNLHVSGVVVPTQAINHGLFIVYANFCGDEGDIRYCGGSIIAAPDGRTLALAGPGEALLIADLGYRPDPALLQTQMADYRRIE